MARTLRQSPAVRTVSLNAASAGSIDLLSSISVTAGSLVVVLFRYDGTETTVTINDGVHSDYTIVQTTSSANVSGLAYKWNHNGGGIVNPVVTFAANRSYRGLVVLEFDGDATFDPLDGTITGETDWSQLKSAAGAGTGIMIGASDVGTFAASTGTLQHGEPFFGVMTQAVTAGNNTLTATGNSGGTCSLVAFFLDSVAALTISTNPSAQSVTEPATATFTGTFTGTASSATPKRKIGGAGAAVDVVGGTNGSNLGAGTLSYTTGATSVTGGNHNNGDTYGFLLQPGAVETTYALLNVSPENTPPVLTGSITTTNLTATSYTLSWPAASDNVGVAGYDYSLDGGTGWTSLGAVLTVNVTGRTPSTTDQVRVRARDAAGNLSTPVLSTSVTLLAATTGVTMTGPTSGTSGVASSNFTIGVTPVGSYFAGTLVVTPSDAADGGTFTPSSINLTVGSPSATFTYTAATGGIKTISVTNNGGFSDPSNIAFTAAAPDTTPPTLTGSITVTNLTHNSYTLTWPVGSDNVAVAGYDYSLDGGASYISLGNVLTVNVSGRTPSATDQVRVRARDTSGNLSTPVLSTAVTLNAPPDVTLPVLTGTITVTNLTHNSYTAAWSNATDNVGVTGYEYSLNGGSTWTSAGLVTLTNISGRTPSSTDVFLLRAFDAAGNRSTPALSANVNLLATPVITSSPLRNGSNMLHLGAPFTAYVYNPTSGARILTKTGLVSHATTGVVTFSDNLLSRTPLRVVWKRTDLGTYGLETLTPT